MKTLRIKSQVFGRDFNFFMAPAGGQIYLKDVERYGVEPRPIEWQESGEPVMATPKSFKTVCNQWYEKHMASERHHAHGVPEGPRRELRPRYNR